MTAPHIREIDPSNWHEVPATATIPGGVAVLVTTPDGRVAAWWGEASDVEPRDRSPECRYFTAEPIPDPREVEIEAEARRLHRLICPALDDAWEYTSIEARADFRTLAIDSLDRQARG